MTWINSSWRQNDHPQPCTMYSFLIFGETKCLTSTSIFRNIPWPSTEKVLVRENRFLSWAQVILGPWTRVPNFRVIGATFYRINVRHTLFSYYERWTKAMLTAWGNPHTGQCPPGDWRSPTSWSRRLRRRTRELFGTIPNETSYSCVPIHFLWVNPLSPLMSESYEQDTLSIVSLGLSLPASKNPLTNKDWTGQPPYKCTAPPSPPISPIPRVSTE